MTIALVYQREEGSAKELIVASDSRLSGGESWDECQKVFPLSRGDCALAFTGDFRRFYPIFCQIVTYCNLHKKIYSRALPLKVVAGNIRQMAQKLISGVKDLPSGSSFPDGSFQLLLCGWDFATGSPFCRRFTYREATGEVFRQRVDVLRKRSPLKHRVYLIGDCVEEVRRRYNERAEPVEKLNLEPLKIIQEIVDSNDLRTIGGSMQGVKLYRHLNYLPLQVERGGKRHVFGRELFDWEETEYEVSSVEL